MNIALILAGGNGIRTGNAVPKQFLTVYDKPIILYTMQNLQRCDSVDSMIVVCTNGWENFVRLYAKQYDITKLLTVITGGEDRYHSMVNGVNALKNICSPEDKVVLLDANRPLIPHQVVVEAIDSAKSGTCSIATELCFDSMFISRNGITVEEEMCRDILYKGQNPEVLTYQDITKILEMSWEEGITKGTIITLALRYKYNIMIVPGSTKSFKITTADDIDLFKAYIDKFYNAGDNPKL